MFYFTVNSFIYGNVLPLYARFISIYYYSELYQNNIKGGVIMFLSAGFFLCFLYGLHLVLTQEEEDYEEEE